MCSAGRAGDLIYLAFSFGARSQAAVHGHGELLFVIAVTYSLQSGASSNFGGCWIDYINLGTDYVVYSEFMSEGKDGRV